MAVRAVEVTHQLPGPLASLGPVMRGQGARGRSPRPRLRLRVLGHHLCREFA
ncbi:hypothetical protein ACFQVA_22575 [Actinomadura keratinilytica]